MLRRLLHVPLHLFDVQIERFKIEGLEALAQTAANDWKDIWAGTAAGSGPSAEAEKILLANGIPADDAQPRDSTS